MYIFKYFFNKEELKFYVQQEDRKKNSGDSALKEKIENRRYFSDDNLAFRYMYRK